MRRKTRREEKLECSARNRLKDIAICSLITIELGESKDENLGFYRWNRHYNKFRGIWITEKVPHFCHPLS